MDKILKKLIEDWKKDGTIKESLNMVYDGELFSLNDLYSSGHWRTRASLKKKYRKIFSDLIQEYKPEFRDKFSLIIFYNTRHDPGNITGMEKMFTDVLKTEGVIKDDSKRHYKLYAVVPDLELPQNTLNFILLNNDGS